jgi:hypothetical protein
MALKVGLDVPFNKKQDQNETQEKIGEVQKLIKYVTRFPIEFSSGINSDK